jgi:hypothetical protein
MATGLTARETISRRLKALNVSSGCTAGDRCRLGKPDCTKSLLNTVSTRLYHTERLFDGNWHRLCVAWRVDKSRIYRRHRRSQIEFLWIQLEDVIEHGKNKNIKTKLELMQRIYRLLAKTQPKTKREKKRWVSAFGFNFCSHRLRAWHPLVSKKSERHLANISSKTQTTINSSNRATHVSWTNNAWTHFGSFLFGLAPGHDTTSSQRTSLINQIIAS